MNLIQDGLGNTSSMRVAFLAWVVGVLIVWVVVSVLTKTLADIPAGVQMVLGIAMSGKVAQAFAENKEKQNED